MNRRRTASRRGFPANLYTNPDGYFYYRNPENGKKKGLGRDKATAFSEARAANRALDSTKKSSLAQWVSGIDVMTLKEWLPKYREMWVDKKSPAATTLQAADRYFDRFAATDFANMPMNEITTLHIAKYLDELTENSGKGAAVNIRTRLLDIFNYAATKGHIEGNRNPVAATIPANYKPTRDRLSLEQFLKMRERANPWLVNAMNLALVTGQRVSDISDMRFADVKDGFLYVDQMKSQGANKLKLNLTIRLSAIGLSIDDAVKQCRDKVLSKHLVHHMRTSGNYKAGEKVSADGISNAFSDLRDELKIKPATGKTPATFHEIRSLAKRLYTEEYGAKFSQDLLGHKTSATSEKYDDLRGSDWKVVSVK